MGTILLVLLGLFVFWVFSLLFFLLRNEWVCSTRLLVLHQDRASYTKLPDYDTMLYKFWVWDVNKFIQEDK